MILLVVSCGRGEGQYVGGCGFISLSQTCHEENIGPGFVTHWERHHAQLHFHTTMASAGENVTFHLMDDVASSTPKKTFKLMMFGTESWKGVLAALKFSFCISSQLFLFDIKTGKPVKFEACHLHKTYYVTDRACTYRLTRQSYFLRTLHLY